MTASSVNPQATILAIETSTGPCSAALMRGGELIWQDGFTQPGQQAGRLMPLVGEGLKQSGLSFFELDIICSSVGPGSFTGIRIGLAAARGIAYATKLPMSGFTTLMVLASKAQKELPVLACLNAGKGDVYWQVFSPELAPLCAAQVAPPAEAIAQAKALCDGKPLCGISSLAMPEDEIVFEISTPDAGALARLAAQHASAEKLQPFYIRPPDAALPSASKKLRMSE